MVTAIAQLVDDVLRTAKEMGDAPQLAERELIRLALSFANAVSWHKIQSTGRFLLAGRAGVVWVFPNMTQTPAPADFQATYGEAHQRFRAGLRAITDGRVNRDFVQWVERDASRVVLVPSFELGHGALEVKHQHLPQDLDAGLSYVLALLLDKTRPYRKALRCCRFVDCGQFFLPEPTPTGRVQRTYCSRQHMQAAHAQDAARRVRKYRERKRAAKAARKPK